ncbi:efflux RND transporter periplasmic adaptor subunit [Thalassotalea psychrophila]|uniref:Efflux RND transporter periplasmic adaptor subunit n=1 Tax=Thalassotalea psychrophila TaxID=3065647 RepID=A0ABY9TU08_9GAMM|nr:efflux RND transporter periplasmic adaptor subunit [Colwelliaceae bacterium SQ149]
MCITRIFKLIVLTVLLSNPAITSHAEEHLAEEFSKLTEQTDVQASQYVCPMHSHIIKDHPGKCPICGMDLVEVVRSHSVDTNVEVTVPGHIQQNMALTTERAETSVLWRFIETFGSVKYDENGQVHLHPRTTGWVEQLTVKTLGESVKKGQLLYEIYSPELLLAQDEYLSLYRDQTVGKNLKKRGRTRLNLLGLNDAFINKLEQRNQSFYRVPYYAPSNGIVAKLDIREGMYVSPENELMMLADTAKVWVIVDVFEHQMDWVKTGKWVEFDLPALGIFAREGKVEYIYPALDPITRTLKVRLSLDNPDGAFKPEMIANVRIYGGATDEVLNVPVQALIQTEQQNRVIVKTSDDKFIVKHVAVGTISQGRAEIISGLNTDDVVVTSGQFLIDSEANIQSAIQQMSNQEMEHKGMEMDHKDMDHQNMPAKPQNNTHNH